MMNKKLIPGLKTCFAGLVIAMFMFTGCSDSSTSSTTKSATDTVKMDTANTRPVKTPD